MYIHFYIQQHVLVTSFASTFSRSLNFLHRTQTYICHQHRMLWLAWCWVCLVGLWCRSRSGVRCVSAAWRSDWQRPRVRPGYSFQAPDSQTWRVIKTILNHTIIKNSSPEESCFTIICPWQMEPQQSEFNRLSTTESIQTFICTAVLQHGTRFTQWR